jgi:hypothetical protein
MDAVGGDPPCANLARLQLRLSVGQLLLDAGRQFNGNESPDRVG